LAAHSESNEVQNVRNQIAPGSSGNSSACSGASAENGPCAQLKNAVDANRRDWALSVGSYVGAGALGAAALATWILWKPKSGALSATPTVGARSAGLVVAGAW
jgi:hypothetical protein